MAKIPFDAGFVYNVPDAGEESSIGTQFTLNYWLRKSLIDARKKQIFGQLADTTVMPKHHGKEIVAYHYIPLLDDRNVNDQGIDATGAKIKDGNLYGSSKDVGKILERMPMLGENGGRVNRVGTIRLTIKGRINQMGIFEEWSKDSLQFDTDPELMTHMHRELITGATQIVEDMLQVELLSSAGTIYYSGIALKDDEVTGEGANISEVTYKDLTRLNTILDDNRTPKNTRIITGSPFTDTRVIPACRVMYVGTELEESLTTMVDNFGNPAFIPVQHYAAAGNLLNGEIGTVGRFRIVAHDNMQHWAGKGAPVTDKDTPYRHSDDKYDIYPMLVVGDGSFTHIGFEGAGSQRYKFDIITKMPGAEMADRHDPYGKTGFSSIAWWYGVLVMRPERIAILKTVARI